MSATLRPACAPSCATRWQQRISTSSSSSRSRLVCRASAGGASEDAARVVPLPNAVWLLNDMQARFYDVRGSSFVIQRAESDAALDGVRKAGHKPSKHASLRPVKFDPIAALKASMMSNPGATMFLSDGPVVDVDVDELHDASASLHMFGPVTETGMVHVPADTDPLTVSEQDDVFVSQSSSPRRTKMLRFVCEAKGCGVVNIKPINPHAFHHGTAFAQCGSCQKWHLIRDHLNLFNSLRGSLFPRRSAVTPADVPPSLQLKPEGGDWEEVPFDPQWN